MSAPRTGATLTAGVVITMKQLLNTTVCGDLTHRTLQHFLVVQGYENPLARVLQVNVSTIELATNISAFMTEHTMCPSATSGIIHMAPKIQFTESYVLVSGAHCSL